MERIRRPVRDKFWNRNRELDRLPNTREDVANQKVISAVRLCERELPNPPLRVGRE